MKYLRELMRIADEDICLSTTGEFIRLDSFGCFLGFSCVLGKSNENHK